MSGLMTSRRQSRLFLTISFNLGLLALFFWAHSERITLHIQKVGDDCAAILDGRTNSVPCPDLSGGRTGLYTASADDLRPFHDSPWRRIAPASSWRSLSIGSLDGSDVITLLKAGRPTTSVTSAGPWRTVAGEMQRLTDLVTITWPHPLPEAFVLKAELRRPGDDAGILLLQPDEDEGLLFLYNSDARLGTWWRWRDGGPAEPLIGAPYQKSLTSQVQSFIRQMLLGHQTGLLLLLASWLLAMILVWFGRRLRPAESLSTAATAGPRASPGVRRNGNLDRAILVAKILLVFGGSLYIARDLLDGIPHVQDSITYLFQAQTLANGRLVAPAPSQPEFFEQEFLLVKDGRWFGKYPPGYPLLLAFGVRSGVPWLVNPLLAVLTLALLFVLGKAWYGRRVGLLAALLATVSPFFLIMSGTFMAHAAELFWLTLFMVAWTRFLRCKAGARVAQDQAGMGGSIWLLVAGAALGMILLTRQLTTLAVAGPFALIATAGQPGFFSWRQRLISLLKLALVALPFALLLLAYQWSVTGNPLQDPRLLFWSYDHLGFGQDIGQGQNVVTYDTVEGEEILVWQHDPSQPPRGHTPARGVFNLERNWRQLQSHLFGWLPLFTLSFAWIVFAAGQARRADWTFLFTAFSLMIVYVAYWADGIAYGPRYLYAALPAFLLLVARGIQVTTNLIGGRAGKWATGLILAVFIAGGLLIYLPNELDVLHDFNFISRANVATVEASISEPALIFVARENGDWWEYGNYFIGNTPWLDGRIIFARDKGPDSNVKLLANYPDRTPYLLQNGRLSRLQQNGR